VARVIRSGRHLSVRAADALHGALPSYAWALLVPLEQDGEQRCSALAARAGVDVSVASLVHLTDEGVRALAVTRALRAEWAATALAGWDEDDARRLSGLLERLATDLDRAPAAVPSAVP